MAHWAEIDKNNVVVRVLVGNDNHPDEGYQWLVDNLGGNWLKTSYNTHGGVHLLGGNPLRKNFASIGYTYDQDRDAFIPPKPFDSWIFDENACWWMAPIAPPQDEKEYVWNEDTLSWDLVTE